jgi:hypothetical protein
MPDSSIDVCLEDTAVSTAPSILHQQRRARRARRMHVVGLFGTGVVAGLLLFWSALAVHEVSTTAAHWLARAWSHPSARIVR